MAASAAVRRRDTWGVAYGRRVEDKPDSGFLRICGVSAPELAEVAAATDTLANGFLDDSWAYELSLLTAIPTATVYNVSSAAHNCALLALCLGVYRNGLGRGDRGRAALKPMLESAVRDHGVAMRQACLPVVEDLYDAELARPELFQDPEVLTVLKEALLQLTGRAANAAGESTSDFLAPDAPKLWLDRPVILDAARTVVLMCTASHFGLVTLGGAVLELVYDVGLQGEDLLRLPLVSVRLQAGQGDGECKASRRCMLFANGSRGPMSVF
ncbi:hypothetical protein PLESTM_000881400 [Pleodorina starrii]|nr:hypothetical protein PLESTM_000881400 [Pleodorina starrii]